MILPNKLNKLAFYINTIWAPYAKRLFVNQYVTVTMDIIVKEARRSISFLISVSVHHCRILGEFSDGITAYFYFLILLLFSHFKKKLGPPLRC